jgi:hypothetical protein
MSSDHSHIDIPVSRLNHPQDDWPTLLGKLLEDFSRVLQGELKLLGASVEPALERAVVRSLNHMILA